MDSLPLISVIVPVYKVEQYLDRCVESIVNQTYHKLEIILVDDGSPDKCPEMCDNWTLKDKRIQVIHKTNGGLSDARNEGLKVANGEFIGFIDSDDWIATEMYEKLMDAIQKDNSDIAACSVEMIWEDGTPSRMLTKQIDCLLDKNEAQLALLNETELKQPVWYKLYRQKTIDGILFEKGKFHEDVFWSYQAIGNADRVSIIDFVGYFYWQRSGSIMGEKYSLKRLDAVEAKKQRQRYLERVFPELMLRGRIDIQYTCLYHGQMAMNYLTPLEKRFALKFLSRISKDFMLDKADLKTMKTTHRCWLTIERYCFQGCCWLRNICNVGL